MRTVLTIASRIVTILLHQHLSLCPKGLTECSGAILPLRLDRSFEDGHMRSPLTTYIDIATHKDEVAQPATLRTRSKCTTGLR